MIVDDERSLLWLLEQVLGEQGHSVLTASNGREALQIMEREQPDLVISDVMMPVMDGYALLENIRRNPKWNLVRVILTSAAPVQTGFAYQPDEYIEKPYNLETMEAAVARHLPGD